MDTSIKLIVDEPAPGSFFWVLVETSQGGDARRELKSAEDGADSYEAALASGTRALDALLRRREAAAAAH